MTVSQLRQATVILGRPGIAGTGITEAEKVTLTKDIADVHTREFDVRRYDYVGTTVIDRINAAVTDAANQGGGRVVGIVGEQTIRPDLAAIRPKNNVTLDLADGILKVANEAAGYNAIITNMGDAGTLDRFTIRGGLIDQNSAGQEGNTITPGGATPGHAIRLYAFGEVVVEGVEIVGGGTNFILINNPTGEGRIESCRFQFVQAASATPDYDHSAIYGATGRLIVANNRFVSTIDQAARGAVELHSLGATMTGNSVDGYQTMANVSSPDPGEASVFRYGGMVITGNEQRRGNYGIRLWPYAGKALTRVKIADNIIDLSQLDWNLRSACGIAPTIDGTLTGTLEDITITDNDVYFQRGDTRTVDKAGNPIQATFTVGISASGHAGPSNFVRIDDNLVANAPTFGYVMGETSFGTTTFRAKMRGNRARNCGINTAQSDANRAAYAMRGIVVGGEMDRNDVEDTGNPTNEGKHSIHANPATGSGGNRITNTKVVTANGGYMAFSVASTIQTSTKRHTVDLGSIAAGTRASFTVTVQGAQMQDFVIVQPSGALEDGLTYTASITDQHTVTVWVRNETAAAIDPGNRAWRVRVMPNEIDI
jgi:hypothetical protein